MFYYYGIDWTYIVLVLPAILFSMWASVRVNSTFKKYSRMRNSRGMTGADAARAVLEANGVYGVRIERIAGDLTDHYDPRTNVIRLSDSVYDAATPAAVGVAAHEAGHAVQYAQGYAPVKVRTAILPVCNIGSSAAMPLFFLGLFFSYDPLMMAGILAYATVTLFQLVTLPVEFNASHRALLALERGGYLTEDELPGARKVLSAAALTYVASALTALVQCLRLISLYGNRKRR